MQYIHHTSHPGVLAKGDYSLTIGVGKLLVIQETYVLFQDRVQEGHITLLCLDGVREEAVRLVGDQLVHRYLLDAEDDRGRADVLLKQGACRLVRLGGIRSSVAGLHNHLHARPDEAANVRRG